MTDKKSNWLKAIVGLTILHSFAAVFFISEEPLYIFAIPINLFIAYRLWNKNVFWRNIEVYIRIPLTLLFGVLWINEYDYTGELVVIQSLILIVLFLMCWNEFPRYVKDLSISELEDELIRRKTDSMKSIVSEDYLSLTKEERDFLR
ncbi:MAG: hypothetical protein Q8M94_09355 [Ignavibacteria bacterium]|nr:hypothetical protein [Ignavibacteria bacterium]